MRRAAVTGCDLNYAAGAEAVLRGLRRFHPEVERFVFVLPSERDELVGRFAGLAEVITTPRPLAGVPVRGYYQIVPARVFLNTFPHDVVAWLDSDLVICRPLPELWEVPPGRVRAVMDSAETVFKVLPTRYHDAARQALPTVAERRGFNSGVFAIRPTDWPDLPERFERGLAACDFPDFPPLFDQALLNYVWLDKLDPLGVEYNFHGAFGIPVPAGARVVHFVGRVKPWLAEFPQHEPAYYYWLRYGLGEERTLPLLRAKLRIWARTPRRLAARFLRERGLFGTRTGP